MCAGRRAAGPLHLAHGDFDRYGVRHGGALHSRVNGPIRPYSLVDAYESFSANIPRFCAYCLSRVTTTNLVQHSSYRCTRSAPPLRVNHGRVVIERELVPDKLRLILRNIIHFGGFRPKKTHNIRASVYKAQVIRSDCVSALGEVFHCLGLPECQAVASLNEFRQFCVILACDGAWCVPFMSS